ncbi:MAG: cell division protein CrgA [Actinomycetaceae bacterium]|nr:cell division protein CrgA [Actinomycetaceae bacterium]
MPESRKRQGAAHHNQQDTELNPGWSAHMKPSPTWWAPTSVVLMLIGLLYVIVFYLLNGAYPVPGIGNWNLAIGFGVVAVGFLMLLRWK